MDKENFVSRFFTYNDVFESNIVWELNGAWWSRFYEYIWASSLIEKDDVVLDSACGVCHPFKFYLVNKCKQVYACDIDLRILSKGMILKDIKESVGNTALNNFDPSLVDKVIFDCCDISNTPYAGEMFDKICCISVFEHLSEELQEATLKEYSRLLKKDGLLILTLDYPNVSPDRLLAQAEKYGLIPKGRFNYVMPSNPIKCDYWGSTLYCFRAVFRKEEEEDIKLGEVKEC